MVIAILMLPNQCLIIVRLPGVTMKYAYKSENDKRSLQTSNWSKRNSSKSQIFLILIKPRNRVLAKANWDSRA